VEKLNQALPVLRDEATPFPRSHSCAGYGIGTSVGMHRTAGRERPLAGAGNGVTYEKCNTITAQDTEHLRRAIELSDLAASRRYGHNPPYGAVLVLGDGTVLEGWNHSISNHNPTHHAELWLISHAFESLDWRGKDGKLLAEATLYASTEPCEMCAGAIYWAGIGRVVFGCSAGCLADVRKEFFPESFDTGALIPSRQILGYAGEKAIVLGPCLEEESRRVHERHWPAFFRRMKEAGT
jgi:tRNA(Arg) A34 adenosine deaminase TadA